MKYTVFKLILPIVLVFNFWFSKSQIPEPSFESKPYFEFLNKKKEILQKILYSNETGHYTLFANGRHGNGKKTVRKFDLSFQPIPYRINFKFPKKTFEPRTVDITPIGKKLYHIWKVRKKESIQYFVQEIDLLSKVTLQEKLITEVHYINGNSTRTKSQIKIDKENHLHLITEILGNQQGGVMLQLDSFDENLSKKRTTIYELPHSIQHFSIQKVLPYQNDGFILIGKNHSSWNKSKSVRQKEYEYFVYYLFDRKTNLVKRISPNNKHMNGLALEINGDHLIITAFIDNHNITRPNSIYVFKYDLSQNRIVFDSICDLPPSFYDYPEIKDKKIAAIKIGFQNKKWLADGNYKIKEIFSNQQDETIIVSEQEFYTQNLASSPVAALITPNNNFYSKDIVVFKISKDGQLLWHSKVIKNQEWGSNDILSYYPVFKNNTLFLFYNGNYINPESSGRNFLNEHDSALLCTIIGENGGIQQRILEYYTEEYPNVILPSLSHYNKELGAILYHRAPGNLKRQKFTQVELR